MVLHRNKHVCGMPEIALVENEIRQEWLRLLGDVPLRRF